MKVFKNNVSKLVVLGFAVVIAIIIAASNNTEVFASQIKVDIPDFEIIMNGVKIDNNYRKYPFIVYRGITYFPMTYYDSRFLGLQTNWGNSTGLEINKTNISYPYTEDAANKKNYKNYKAVIPLFKIKINGKYIDNRKTEYPLLTFRDVTYFPLTWDYSVNEFGWDYKFDSSSGLRINSGNSVSKELELVDYIENGNFILSGDYIYYEGKNGEVYKAMLNNLRNNKVVYKTPDESTPYHEGRNYAYAFFDKRDNQIYFTYHVGGATMGSTYEVKINVDDTVSKPVSVGFGIAPGHFALNGYVLDWSSDANSYGYKAPRYETEDFDYLIAYRENVAGDYSRIYKLNKKTNEITLISDITTPSLKYREGSIYFVSHNSKLYSFKANEEIVKEEIGKNISDIDNFEVLKGNFYYINKDDQKAYIKSSEKPLNNGEKASSVSLNENYIILNFESAAPNVIKTVLYDGEGKEVFKSANRIYNISIYSNKIAYYDEVFKKVFIVELK